MDYVGFRRVTEFGVYYNLIKIVLSDLKPVPMLSMHLVRHAYHLAFMQLTSPNYMTHNV